MINELFRTERARIGDLVPHVKNPRKIKSTEKQKLWERLQKFGMLGIPQDSMEVLKAEFDAYVDLDSFGLSLEALSSDLAGATADVAASEPELPIVAQFSEQYDAIVIVCRNAIDLNHLSEKLGLDTQQCYKSSKVGTTHVLEGKAVIAALSEE